MSSQDNIRWCRKGRVAVVTLDRAERANAYTDAMVGRLDRLLDEFAGDGALGALVISGTGRHFCAGADLDEIRSRISEDAFSIPSMALFDKVEALPMPVVAAVNGAAMAGGLELALACDLRVASDKARFALPETALGIIPAAGGTWRLPRLVGPALAREMILFGRELDAAAALRAGLVSEVVPGEDLMTRALALAAAAATRDRPAQSLAKAALNSALNGDTGREVVKEAQSRLYGRKKGGRQE